MYFPKTRPRGSLLAGTNWDMSCLLLPPLTLNRSPGTAVRGSCGVSPSLKFVLHSTKCEALHAQRKENIKKELEQRGFLHARQHSTASQNPPWLCIVLGVSARAHGAAATKDTHDTHGFCSLTISLRVQQKRVSPDTGEDFLIRELAKHGNKRPGRKIPV